MISEKNDEHKNIYLIMNKPAGYVCSAVSDSHKTVYQLLAPELQELVTKPKRGHRLHTVGRLDADTTGLLLFTTDGQFSHYITAPENKIEKKYFVTLKEEVTIEKQKLYIEKVAEGIILPEEKKSREEKSSPATLQFINKNKCIIKIHEGKFHQVRRTFLSLGNLVTTLKRISISTLELPEELTEGQYKYFLPDKLFL